VYRDTTITIYLPGDTIIQKVPVVIENNKAKTVTPAFANNEYCWAAAWINDNVLSLWLVTKEQTLNYTIKNALQTLETSQTDSHSWREKEVIQVKYIPRVYKVALWIAIGSVITLLAWLYFKIKGV